MKTKVMQNFGKQTRCFKGDVQIVCTFLLTLHGKYYLANYAMPKKLESGASF